MGPGSVLARIQLENKQRGIAAPTLGEDAGDIWSVCARSCSEVEGRSTFWMSSITEVKARSTLLGELMQRGRRSFDLVG